MTGMGILNGWLLQVLQLAVLTLTASILYDTYRVDRRVENLCLLLSFTVIAAKQLIQVWIQTGYLFFSQPIPHNWAPVVDVALQTFFYIFFAYHIYLRRFQVKVNFKKQLALTTAMLSALCILVGLYWQPYARNALTFNQFWGYAFFGCLHLLLITGTIIYLYQEGAHYWIKGGFYLLFFAHLVGLMYPVQAQGQIYTSLADGVLVLGYLILATYYLRYKIQTELVFVLISALIIPGLLTISMVSNEVQNRLLALIPKGISSSQAAVTMFNIERILYLIAGWAVVLASLIGYLIARRIIKPIGDLVLAAKRVGGGNLGIKVETRRRDELGNLVNQFNQMSINLKETTSKLKLSNARAKRINETLRRIQKKLLRADKLLFIQRLVLTGRLAAGVVHELSNPLTSIQSYLKYALQKTNKNDSRYKPLQIAVRETARFGRTLHRLRRFSRPAAAERAPVDLNVSLENALTALEYQISRAEVKVIKDLTMDLPEVMANADELQQVFINIILNAKDAMRDGGRLSIATRAENGTVLSGNPKPQIRNVIVKFTDTGCGIPDEKIKDIFTPFFSTKERDHGTGLGLPVSQAIIEALGGTVQVQSQVGKGTTFTIKLPPCNGQEDKAVKTKIEYTRRGHLV